MSERAHNVHWKDSSAGAPVDIWQVEGAWERGEHLLYAGHSAKNKLINTQN